MVEEVCLTHSISPLMYESIYHDYLFNKIHQEQVLSTMINKQLIMTESTTLKEKERKLSALYEAKVGDKIKSGWNKFIDFISSLFSKFMESMTSLLFSYKKYLAKYRDIILNKKFKISLTDPLPGNYVEATKRCFNVSIPAIQYNDTYMKPLKDGDNYEILKLIIKDGSFKRDEGRELSEDLKDYFLGIDLGTIDSLDKLNRADMYNFCYNAEKIEQFFNKDLTTLKNTTNTIERAITAELSKTESYITEEIKVNDKRSPGSAKAVNDINNKNNGTSSNVKVNDTRASSGNYKNNATATQNNNQNNDNGASKPGQAKINTNPINNTNIDGNENKEDLKKQGQAANAAGETDEIISGAFDNWRRVCQAVIAAKFTALEAIAKDYMGIIRAHVRSYVGKKGDEQDNQSQKATNYNNQNNNQQQQNNKNTQQQQK